MAASLNGWPGITAAGPSLARRLVPGTTRAVTLQAAVLPLFLAYLADWHKTVMPIDGSRSYLGPDGWEYRDARTGAGLSNHASGTAVDVRYDVLKADHQRHMTPAQINAVHRLLDKYVDSSGRRVFGWGGDWVIGKFCDEMHTELAQDWAVGAHGRNTTLADVRAVIARLKIRPDGTVADPPAPYPGKPIGWPSPRTCSSGPAIVTLEKCFGLPITGQFSNALSRKITGWQLTHPGPTLKDRVGPGAAGLSLYTGIVAKKYPGA